MISKPAAVHQFHPGTAEGDAVTQQMLSLQARLRRLGYRSEVYALEIPPALQTAIHHLDEYVVGPDQVLFLHHSIGNPVLDRIAGLPDPKVLCYHNITPEEYFDSDVMRQAIRLGRAQLRRLPGLTGAAIANSNFSRRELLAAGFDGAEVLPVQTAFDAFGGGAPSERTRDWLSVGRVVGNKCQHEIVQAFGVYATAFDPEAHLHLIGDPSDRFYVAELHDLAKQMGVGGRLHVWGKISHDELVRRYQTSGLYLSLSEHEGFGVPLLEAMAAGLPVVAFASTAVPETMGGAGIQLQDKDPWFVAGLAKTLADDDALRGRLVARQTERIAQLAAFDVDAVLERAIRRSLGEKQPLRVQLQGPFETSYSLATLNRELALALDRAGGVDVSIYATEGPGDYTPRAQDLRAHPAAARLHAASAAIPYPDVSIRQLYPPRVADSPGALRTLYFGWEESRIPAEYAASFNAHLDGIGTMSTYVRDLLRGSGVTVPIAVTGVGVEAPNLDPANLPDQARDHKGFVFLHISSALPRKAIDVIVAAYFATFSADDDVTLVLKTHPNPHNEVLSILSAARGSHPSPPDVCWIDEDLPRRQIESLYGIASCYVHPARGEGFGLPVAEAMLAEVPVITVGHGGLADFCSDDTALIVPHRIEPARTHLTVPGSTWAEPDQAELARLLREVYDGTHRDELTARVARAKAIVEDQFSWDAVAARWTDLIDVLRAEARTLDVAMVTPWNSRCGIAEYSRQLVDGFGSRARTRVFADRNVQPIDLGEEPSITRIWDDRWHPDLSELTAAIAGSPAELVHVQFNFGFFELEALAGFISAVAPNRAVAVTFHATADTPIDGEVVSLGSIAGALGRADLLIVHQQADVDRLAEFGLVDNVRLVPQGAPGPPSISHERAREALLLGSRPTVSTFGFLLPHKGTLELLRAIDLVRRDLPDVLLLAPCAIHPDPTSAQYLDACVGEIARLGLGPNVTLMTEFLPDDEARTLLAASDVIVLPYADTPESSSAALRFVLGIGAPVVTTDIRIFADAADALLQTPSNEPEDLAAAILDVLGSPARASQLAAAAQHRAAELSWSSVAQTHLSAYHRLLAARHARA